MRVYLALVCALAYISAASAACDTTIAASSGVSAIKSAINGGTGPLHICLESGTFTAASGDVPLNAAQRSVLIISGNGVNNTFLDVADLGVLLSGAGAQNASLVLRDLSVSDATGVVSVTGLNATLTRVYVSGCVSTTHGVAVYGEQSTLSVNECTFEGNSGVSVIAGVNSDVSVSGANLLSNTVRHGSVFVRGSLSNTNTTVDDVYVYGSMRDGPSASCGGLRVVDVTTPVVLSNSLFDTLDDAGLCAESASDVYVTNTGFARCGDASGLAIVLNASAVVEDTGSPVFVCGSGGGASSSFYSSSSSAGSADPVLCVDDVTPSSLNSLCDVAVYARCSQGCGVESFCVASDWPASEFISDNCAECDVTCGVTQCALYAQCGNATANTYDTNGDDCVCEPGFEGDGSSLCINVDECATGASNCTAAKPVCIDTFGSYTCSDTDECAAALHNCDTHATCTNSLGSFTCECDANYIGDGLTCLSKCNEPEFDFVVGVEACDFCIELTNDTFSEVSNALAISGDDTRICFGIGVYTGFSSGGFEVTANNVSIRGSGVDVSVLSLADGERAFVTTNARDFDIRDLTIDGGGRLGSGPHAPINGAGLSVTGGSAALSNIKFSFMLGNEGGCLSARNAEVTVTDAELSECTAAVGGAFYTVNSKLDLDFVTFIDNDADDSALGYFYNTARSNVSTWTLVYAVESTAGDVGGTGGVHIESSAGSMLLDSVLIETTVGAVLRFVNTTDVTLRRVGAQGTANNPSNIAVSSVWSDIQVSSLVVCEGDSVISCSSPGVTDELCALSGYSDCAAACAATPLYCVSPYFSPVSEIDDECPSCSANCDGTICGERAVCGELAASDDQCFCPTGYEYEDASSTTSNCDDIDECATGAHNCGGLLPICVNTAGSFACADNDECSSGAHNCGVNSTCTNTLGGFECDCNAGLFGDGVFCDPICEHDDYDGPTAGCDFCQMPEFFSRDRFAALAGADVSICFASGTFVANFDPDDEEAEPNLGLATGMYVGGTGADSTVINCDGGLGFAIVGSHSDITIANLTLSNCGSDDLLYNGPAIDAEGGSRLTLDSINVVDCTSLVGAVNIDTTDELTITNTAFERNTGAVAALRLTNCNGSVTDSVFRTNHVTASASTVVDIRDGEGDFTFKTNLLANNTAVSGGGGGLAVTGMLNSNFAGTNLVIENNGGFALLFSDVRGGKLTNVGIRGATAPQYTVYSFRSSVFVQRVVMCDCVSPEVYCVNNHQDNYICTDIETSTQCSSVCGGAGDFCVPDSFDIFTLFEADCGTCGMLSGTQWTVPSFQSQTSEIDPGAIPTATGAGQANDVDVKSHLSLMMGLVLGPIGLVLFAAFAVAVIATFNKHKEEKRKKDVEDVDEPIVSEHQVDPSHRRGNTRSSAAAGTGAGVEMQVQVDPDVETRTRPAARGEFDFTTSETEELSDS